MNLSADQYLPKVDKTGQMTQLAFLVGSWFLYDLFQYCTQIRKSDFLGFIHKNEPEWMHYATGSISDGTRVVERIVTFGFSQQTPTFVKGNPMETRDVLNQDGTIWIPSTHGMPFSSRKRD